MSNQRREERQGKEEINHRDTEGTEVAQRGGWESRSGFG